MKISLIENQQFPNVILDGYAISLENFIKLDSTTVYPPVANVDDIDVLIQVSEHLSKTMSSFDDNNIELYIYKEQIQSFWILKTVIDLAMVRELNISLMVYDSDDYSYKKITIENVPMPKPKFELPSNQEQDDMRVHVGAMIRDKDGKVLVEDHIKKDGLVFPGGKVQSGEDPGSTLFRELKEELGIKCIQATKICEFEGTGTYPADSDNVITWKSIIYDVSSYDGQITNKEPDKCRELYWFNEATLVKQPNLKEQYYFYGPGKSFRDKHLKSDPIEKSLGEELGENEPSW